MYLPLLYKKEKKELKHDALEISPLVSPCITMLSFILDILIYFISLSLLSFGFLMIYIYIYIYNILTKVIVIQGSLSSLVNST